MGRSNRIIGFRNQLGSELTFWAQHQNSEVNVILHVWILHQYPKIQLNISLPVVEFRIQKSE